MDIRVIYSRWAGGGEIVDGDYTFGMRERDSFGASALAAFLLEDAKQQVKLLTEIDSDGTDAPADAVQVFAHTVYLHENNRGEVTWGTVYKIVYPSGDEAFQMDRFTFSYTPAACQHKRMYGSKPLVRTCSDCHKEMY